MPSHDRPAHGSTRSGDPSSTVPWRHGRPPRRWLTQVLAGPHRWVPIAVSVMALLATACGSAVTDPPVPRTGPASDGIRLELSTGAARPGQVVTARLVGRGLDSWSSSGLVEVTCGAKDTRVSHPVQGVTGTAPPPSGRAPEVQPFVLPAGVALRFTVPQVSTGICVVSRSVRAGAAVVSTRTPLEIL